MNPRAKELSNPMQTRLVFITPSYAKAVLEKNNVDNRRLNMVRVDALVQLILNNQWQVTHQGIAFDCNGNLVDGQHRLAAIVKANTPVRMLANYNLEERTKLIIDGGMPRTLGNRLTLAGYTEISSRAIAVARILEYGVVAASQCAITPEEAIKIVTKYCDGINFALSCGNGKGYTAVIQAVVARAYYSVSHNKLHRFVEVYVSEVPTDKTESAALKLKRAVSDKQIIINALHNISGSERVSAKEYLYQITENAISRFIKGESVVALKAVSHELYPLPNQ